MEGHWTKNRSFSVFSDIVFLAKTRTLKLSKNTEQMCSATLSRPANPEHTSPRQSLCMDEKFQSSFFRHTYHLIYKFSLISNEAYLCLTRSSWDQLPKFLNIMERKHYNFQSEKKLGKESTWHISFILNHGVWESLLLLCFFAWQPVLLFFPSHSIFYLVARTYLSVNCVAAILCHLDIPAAVWFPQGILIYCLGAEASKLSAKCCS